MIATGWWVAHVGKVGSTSACSKDQVGAELIVTAAADVMDKPQYPSPLHPVLSLATDLHSVANCHARVHTSPILDIIIYLHE